MHRHSVTITILSASLMWAQIPIVAQTVSMESAGSQTGAADSSGPGLLKSTGRLSVEEQRLWTTAIKAATRKTSSRKALGQEDCSENWPREIGARTLVAQTPGNLLPPPPPYLAGPELESVGAVNPANVAPLSGPVDLAHSDLGRIESDTGGRPAATRAIEDFDAHFLAAAPKSLSTTVPPPPDTTPSMPPVLLSPPPATAPVVSPPPPPNPGVRRDAPAPLAIDPLDEDVVTSEDQERFTGLSRDYKLGPGDQLLIIDPALGTPEQPSTSLVDIGPDGNVVIYPVGVVKAANRTISQLNKIVNELAKQYEDSPHISIALSRERKVTVYVLGDVASPGLWSNSQLSYAELTKEVNTKINAQPLPLSFGGGSANAFQAFGNSALPNQLQAQRLDAPPDTEHNPAAKAAAGTPLTALGAIQLAGGIRDTADIRHIVVRRRSTKKEFQVDLWKLLAEGDFEQDVLLQSGDVVYVPAGGAPFSAEKLGFAANQFRYVRVWGEVRSPGLYILKPNDDVFSVLARAGGFTTVADNSKVELSRVNRNGSLTSRWINMRAAMRGTDRLGREKIQSGDVVIARTSISKKYGPSIVNKIALAGGAILLLYLSRNIVDRSITNNSGTTPVRIGF